MRTKPDDRYAVDPVTGCWNWTARKTTHGYGMLGVKKKTVMAHRYFFERFVGPIPVGLQIDHLCRNRGCVNPMHLEPVTARENSRRAAPFNRRSTVNLCLYGHPLDGVRSRPTGGRYCKTCNLNRKGFV